MNYTMTTKLQLTPKAQLQLARGFLRGKKSGATLLLRSFGDVELFRRDAEGKVRSATIGQWITYFNVPTKTAKQKTIPKGPE